MDCANCGKKLKDAKSLERGYGPVCWNKTQVVSEKRIKTSKGKIPILNINIPGQMCFSDFPNGIK